MFRFVLAALLGAVASVGAQSTGAFCECSVWARDSRPGNRPNILIAAIGTPNLPIDCDFNNTAVEESDCYEACYELGVEFKVGSGICDSVFQDNKNDCYGNVWCERIANKRPGFDATGNYVLSAYASIRNCPDNPDIEYTEITQPEDDQELCCGVTTKDQCNEDDCTCDLGTVDCECGLFIQKLLNKDEWRPNPNVDPLPLQYVGTNFNDTDGEWSSTCWLFPTPENTPEADLCSQFCFAKEDELIGYRLSDPHPNNPGWTYGGVMCQGLKQRVANYEAIQNETMTIYGRVKNCAGAGVGWAETVPFGEDTEEKLCCTEEGDWYECW